MSREGPLVRLATTLYVICYAAIMNKGPRNFGEICVGQKLSSHSRYLLSMSNLFTRYAIAQVFMKANRSVQRGPVSARIVLYVLEKPLPTGKNYHMPTPANFR